MGFRVEEHGADGQPDGNIHRPFEWHIDRTIRDLRGCPREVDEHFIVLNVNRHHQRQLSTSWIGIVKITINIGRGTVPTVRQRCDGLPHQSFGIIHDGIAGRIEGCASVAINQLTKLFCAESCSRDLCFHITYDEIRNSNIVV